MDLIIGIISLILIFIAMIITYGIVIRTCKNLRKGAILLLLALSIIAIKFVFDIFNWINGVFNFNRTIIYILFFGLLIWSLYEIKKCLKKANGESHIKANGKIKIKKRKK